MSLALSLRQAGLSYQDGTVALSPLDLEIKAGERIAILGPSGAGKTSLLRLLQGALCPSEGELTWSGQSIWQLSSGRARRLRAHIATVPQASVIPPRQRVVTAVLAGRLGQWSLLRSVFSLLYPSDIAGARTVLKVLSMDGHIFRRCDQLSGGQLQRVAVARALYQNASLILADEPVAALDPVTAAQMLSVLLTQAKRRGATVVASLHSTALAKAHFDRVIALRDGHLMFDLPMAELTDARIEALYKAESVVHADAPRLDGHEH